MKSILQEASTVAKAIEQGWHEAGQPQEFSVKILELPQRNFIGLTTRSAKIALLFNAVARPPEVVGRQQKPFVPREKRETPPPYRPREQREVRPLREERPVDRVERGTEERPFAPRRSDVLWSDEMVAFGQNWFATVIKHMDRSDITFTIEPQNFYLRLTLSKPVLDDAGQEKHLLASLSFLMLSSLKKNFRKALRGYKIVLTHAK